MAVRIDIKTAREEKLKLLFTMSRINPRIGEIRGIIKKSKEYEVFIILYSIL